MTVSDFTHGDPLSPTTEHLDLRNARFRKRFRRLYTGAGVTHDPVPLKLVDKTYTSDTQIQLWVKKKVDGVEQWMEIEAVKGEPAGKFVTTTDTDWCDEFANIKYAWGNFTQWVKNGTGKFAGIEKDEDYFDRITRNESALTE